MPKAYTTTSLKPKFIHSLLQN